VTRFENQLTASAERFVAELLRMRAGENLLIYANERNDRRLAEAIRAQANRRGCHTDILELSPALSVARQAELIVERIARGAYHAVCELSEEYFYATPVWKTARAAGARLFSLTGLDAPSFVRCVGGIDHRAMFDLGVALRHAIERASTVTVTAANGTDIRMQLASRDGGLRPSIAAARRRSRHTVRRLAQHAGLTRVAARLQTRPSRAFVLEPCGFLDTDTSSTFLGGQLSFRGILDTIEGTAVIDGYLWPPDEIGRVDEPLVLAFRRGKLVDIGGCPTKSRILADRFAAEAIHVEHFCVGFNPGATFGGRILEAERVFGSLTIGMGQRLLHTDGVMKDPSLVADGTVIAANGRFVAHELEPLQHALLG
jgi:leucyl aminopeptidase (aminopeptidase T)